MSRAEGLIKHVARVEYYDRNGKLKTADFAGWTPSYATGRAWKFVKTMRGMGKLRAFRICHSEQVIGVQ